MGVLEDLDADINAYPAANVEIDIIEFTGGGIHINVGEVWDFKVRVNNKGPLNMKNLNLHLRGSTWAFVSRSDDGPFSGEIFSPYRDVGAHSAVIFQTFYIKAFAPTDGGGTVDEDIVSAHISSFDADLSHILSGHAHHAGNPIDNYNRHIHPA